MPLTLSQRASLQGSSDTNNDVHGYVYKDALLTLAIRRRFDIACALGQSDYTAKTTDDYQTCLWTVASMLTGHPSTSFSYVHCLLVDWKIQDEICVCVCVYVCARARVRVFFFFVIMW